MGGAESCLACDAKRGGVSDSSKPERKPLTTPIPSQISSAISTGGSSISSVGEKARVGIGAYFQRDKALDSVLSVKSLLKGSPAQQCAKITVGDHILAVNAISVEAFSLAELAEKLLGPTGSVVECTFARRGTGERYSVALTRGINSDKWSLASRNK
mmetsp:Transcript_8873/g.21948  ORF Transcript_8873/g.21948 Transcript_8873/m.21948 type:complete len:157 (-) Transcript_8873:83-553(-)